METRSEPQSKTRVPGPVSRGRPSRSVMFSISHMLAAYLCYLIIAGFSCSGGGGAAMAQQGFVSVDCGAPAGTYEDANTGIKWISDDNPDADFARGVQGDGLSMTAAVQQQPPRGNDTESFRTLRYFPSDKLSKYCYIFSGDAFDFIQSGTALLVRASFWAGDLTLLTASDHQSGAPSSVTFQLLLNADIWDNVTVTLPQQDVVMKEVYAFPFNSTLPASMSVCLASSTILGMGIPFISSLQLRVMPDENQAWMSQYIKLPVHSVYAIDYGAAPGQGVTRYPDDPMDRIWQPDTSHTPIQSTNRSLPAESLSGAPPPPAKVMQTAYVEDKEIRLVFDVPVGVYYVAEYVFDVSAAGISRRGQRAFIWQTTGYAPNNPLDMFDANFNYWLLSSGSSVPLRPDHDGQLTFTISKTPNSTDGPLINALHLFRDFGSVSPGSDTRDVLSHVRNRRECTCFNYDQIKTITNDFQQKLGQGGFGPVYYGVLQDQSPVAVKVLATSSHQGEREFLNEVEFLSRIHHRSLVPLFGYCVEAQLVLVYEYMANGSLHEAIEGKCPSLNTWLAYLRVAVDAAEGLEYLHCGSDPAIIHRDVKSSNILVSRDMQGKLSDFGISRSKTATGAEAYRFTAVQGSPGYIDPEYVEKQEVTNKVDVYAFGVVLLEICSGRHVFSRKADEDPQHIVNWVTRLTEQGNILEIMNPRFNGCYNISAAWKVIDVAMRCVEIESSKRPNMREVCMELRSALSIELEGEPACTTTFLTTADISAR